MFETIIKAVIGIGVIGIGGLYLKNKYKEEMDRVREDAFNEGYQKGYWAHDLSYEQIFEKFSKYNKKLNNDKG